MRMMQPQLGKRITLVKRGVKVGNKERISLGKLLKNISSVDVFRDEIGTLILRPKVELPAHEVWLFKNPQALSSVQRGLTQAKNQEVVASPMPKHSWVDNLKDE